MIIPIIMNREFERIALCEDFSSFIWTSRYYTCGDFEIVVPADQEHRDLFQPGYYVCRDDDINVGIIEDLSISIDEDQEEQMIVTGRFLSSILGRRIIWPVIKVNDTVSNVVKTLLEDCIVIPGSGNSYRKIDNFTIRNTSFPDKLQTQYTGKNLLEVVEEICKTYKLGFNTILEDGNFVFYLYKGIDRSYAQSENPWVVFSDEYDNLISSNYIYQTSSQITDVMTAGSGEGENRFGLWDNILSNKSGLDRYEYFNDQRNTSQDEIPEDATMEEVNEIIEKYWDELRELGKQQLSPPIEALEGEVYFGDVQYKTDVNLGDVMTVENKKWGIAIDCRLIEVIESVDESGAYNIVPTFETEEG